MSKVVPCRPFDLGFLNGGHPNAPIEVSPVNRSRRVLARKDPYRPLPGIQTPKDRPRLIVQVDILHAASLGLRKGDDSPFQRRTRQISFPAVSFVDISPRSLRPARAILTVLSLSLHD